MKKRKIIACVFILLVSVFTVTMTVVTISNTVNAQTVVSVATRSENKQIQKRLKELGYYKGNIDGILGRQSVSAIRRFQRDYGLRVDGIVGKQTLKALGIKKGNNYTSSDLNLLAKCVYAEARGEPYVGQVAVAAVILNRVKSAKFPNSISGVIYQPWAFTSVHDGQINLRPNNSAYKAAKDALNGWDPSYGCLYYFNPATATSKWIWSRKRVVKIGKHVFAI